MNAGVWSSDRYFQLDGGLCHPQNDGPHEGHFVQETREMWSMTLVKDDASVTRTEKKE